MLRKLLKFILSLIGLAVLLVGGMAAWLVCDGLTDLGEHADVALVPGHGEIAGAAPSPQLKARLDRAVKLYQQGEFPLIVVSGATTPDGADEAAIMGQYLQDHDVPGSAIVEDHQGSTTDLMVRHVAEFMKAREINSVLVVTHYYLVTRLKLALRHEGIPTIDQAHLGKLDQGDAQEIGREAVAIYYDAAKYYFFPAAKMAAEKMESEAEKMKSQAADKMNSIDK
jgi:vancomycin permeability regulator SanA